MRLRIFTVDAFSSTPFSGNPAAVVPLEKSLPEDLLQKIASELNLSDTAYVIPLSKVDNDCWLKCSRFSLRWFTPTNEVPLCGHATLATAKVLFSCLENSSSELEFETKSGCLRARKDGDKVILDFPSNQPLRLTTTQKEVFTPLIEAVTSCLNVDDVLLSPTANMLLIRLHDSYSRNDLETLKCDPKMLLNLHDGSVVKGVIVSVKADHHETGYHFLSRYFAPWNGIPEDPVTGSAHTVLGPYWAKIFNKNVLNCRQCSPRGGDLTLNVRQDNRVDISGDATVVITGYIDI